MSPTDHELLRDRVRTRRAILEAAEQAIVQRGAKVSLAEIAARAGVSKSGLMHHFRSRDELVAETITHTISRMWEEVRAHVDLSENRPGKFTRAYIRALTGGSDYLTNAFSPTGLFSALGQLGATGYSESLEREDALAWDVAFDADGLPPDRTLVLRYAAEGLAAAIHTPYLTPDRLERARAELLARTEDVSDS